jgi:uncharacterized Zn finger protein (UPF0148 family)
VARPTHLIDSKSHCKRCGKPLPRHPNGEKNKTGYCRNCRTKSKSLPEEDSVELLNRYRYERFDGIGFDELGEKQP